MPWSRPAPLSELLYNSLRDPSPTENAEDAYDGRRQRNDAKSGRSQNQKMEGVDVGVAVTNGIEAGEAKILIDPFLSDNPS